MEVRDELQALLDERAITELIHRYARSVDRIDPELGHTIWHPDGVADYGEDIFQGSGKDFMDWVCEGHRQLLGHSHQMSTITITLDGDRAGSETYVTATLKMLENGKVKHKSVFGRYIDQWSRLDARWRLERRVYLHDFDEVRTAEASPLCPRGRRDRDDHSYAVVGRAVDAS